MAAHPPPHPNAQRYKYTNNNTNISSPRLAEMEAQRDGEQSGDLDGPPGDGGKDGAMEGSPPPTPMEGGIPAPPLSLGPSTPLEGPVPASGANLVSTLMEDGLARGDEKENPGISIPGEGGGEVGVSLAPRPAHRVSTLVEEAGGGGRLSNPVEGPRKHGRKRGRQKQEDKHLHQDDRKKSRRQLSIKDMLRSQGITSNVKGPGCDRVKRGNQDFPGIQSGGTLLQNPEVLTKK